MQPAQPFQYRNGELHCEEVPLSRIGREVGTPCYVYSRQAIQQNYRLFESVFSASATRIFYAVKANSNLSVLELLNREGSGFDIVSAGELFRLQAIGVSAQRVIFSGVGKSRAELETALEHSIFCLNLESLDELDLLAALARQGRYSPAISLRLNPEVSAETHPYIATGLRRQKFGMDVAQLDVIRTRLKEAPWLQLTGLGFHIGSQILDVAPFMEAFLKLREIARQFAADGLPVQHLDLGGGFGIPYRDEPPPDLESYAAFLAEQRGTFQLLMEPGRFIAGTAGVFLSRVLYLKENHGQHFVIVDGGMNDLLRPSLYQAHHAILSLQEGPSQQVADVVGPVCESGDYFARDRALPAVRAGDLLAIMNAGAYGFVLSSNYNSRPRVAEVLVEGDRFRIVRKRESLDDLIRGEERE